MGQVRHRLQLVWIKNLISISDATKPNWVQKPIARHPDAPSDSHSNIAVKTDDAESARPIQALGGELSRLLHTPQVGAYKRQRSYGRRNNIKRQGSDVISSCPEGRILATCVAKEEHLWPRICSACWDKPRTILRTAIWSKNPWIANQAKVSWAWKKQRPAAENI